MSGDIPGGGPGGTGGPRRRGHLRAVAEVGPTVPELLETDALLDRLGRHESTAADLDDLVGRLLHGYAVFADPLTSGARPVEVELPAAADDAPAGTGPAALPAPRVLLARRGALQTVGRGTAAACAVLGLFAGTAAAASTSTDALSTIGQRISASADADRPTVPGPILNFFAGSAEERVNKVVQRAQVSAEAGNVAGAADQVQVVADRLAEAKADPSLFDVGRLSTDPTALDLLLDTVALAAKELETEGKIGDETVQRTVALAPTATPVTTPATTPATPVTATIPRTLTDLFIEQGRSTSDPSRPPLVPETTSPTGSTTPVTPPVTGVTDTPTSGPTTPPRTSTPAEPTTTPPTSSEPTTTEPTTTPPTTDPTTGPTDQPTGEPTDGGPTTGPTSVPTAQTAPPPSSSPETSPESSPETSPVASPTDSPSEPPVQFPLPFPTSFPTEVPTTAPVEVSPVVEPTARPTDPPTDPVLTPIGTGGVPSPTQGVPVTPVTGLV